LDGPISQKEYAALMTVAELLGLDLDALLESRNCEQVEIEARRWWVILEVSPDSDYAVVKRAHRKLVSKYHPDLWGTASEEERQSGEARLVQINAAWSEARIVFTNRRTNQGNRSQSRESSPEPPSAPMVKPSPERKPSKPSKNESSQVP